LLELGLQEGSFEFITKRDALLDRLTNLDYDLVQLIKECMEIMSRLLKKDNGEFIGGDIAATMCLQDIEKNPQLPLLQQFLEMRLWRNMEQLNRSVKKSVEKITAPKITKGHDSPASSSFRDWYMKRMVSDFGDEFNEIRQASTAMNLDHLDESTSPNDIKLLIDCIELALKSFDQDEAYRLMNMEENKNPIV
jgi:hypothetical protein